MKLLIFSCTILLFFAKIIHCQLSSNCDSILEPMMKNGMLLRDFVHNNDSEVLTDEEIEEFQILENQLNITPDNRNCITTENLKFVCGLGTLFTSCSSHVRIYLSDDFGNLHRSNLHKIYNYSRQDVIVIHGFQANSGARSTQVMQKILLKTEAYNVFVVDWSSYFGPKTLCYLFSSINLKKAAKCVAKAIDNTGLLSNRIDACVGFSLGAHLCGTLKNHVNFNHIYGLDPAGPIVAKLDTKLQSGDADVVEIFHTNAGGYGIQSSLGDKDFYFNGGHKQPYCKYSLFKKSCNHFYSICFFGKYLNSLSMLSKYSSVRGSIYLDFNEKPYCPDSCQCSIGDQLCFMPNRKGLLAPQNTFLDTIATRFDGTHSNFVLGNAQVLSVYPIVYCSDGFCDLTGYTRAQIMHKGCACEFMYGAETKEDIKQLISKALESKTELKIEMICYKKNNSPFWCLVDIVPIKNENRDVVLFLASFKDVTSEKMAEMSNSDLYDSAAVLGAKFRSENCFLPHHDTDQEDNSKLLVEGVNYERRRSRAVLYQLSGHYKQEKIKGKLKINNNLLNSTQSPLPEYKTTSIKKSRYIISHYGVFKTCWDWLMLVATFYIAIVVPYNASFVSQEKPSIITDVVVEALFIIDILLNFRTTYASRKGEIISNTKLIAFNYLRTWFLVDLLAAVPFHLLYASDVIDPEETTQGHIHLVKLTRLLRLAKILQKVERYSQYGTLVLTLLMLSFTLVAHWLACVWYIIAENERRRNHKNWNLGWINNLADRLKLPVDNITYVDSYVTALYFTCSSLTSVGFGNVSANTTQEKIFSIVLMLIGALMHAVVFGNVTAIIQRMYSRRSLYQTKWRDLKDFFALHQVPKELKQRMQDYFQTMWSLNHGIDIHETLKEFPEELRGDVSMHLHREILQLPIFERASQGCLKLLSLHIRGNFCAPGEYLIHKDDAVNYIHYICNGSMEVIQNAMVVAILGKGDLIGCDINKQLKHCGKNNQDRNNNNNKDRRSSIDVIVKSNSDVRALTYCDLKSIHIPGLIEVLRLYPEFQQDFANDIQHDLTYNVRDGLEDVEVAPKESLGSALTLPSIIEDEYEISGSLNSVKSNNDDIRLFGKKRALSSIRKRVERKRSVRMKNFKKKNTEIQLNPHFDNYSEEYGYCYPDISHLHRELFLMGHEVKNMLIILQGVTTNLVENSQRPEKKLCPQKFLVRSASQPTEFRTSNKNDDLLRKLSVQTKIIRSKDVAIQTETFPENISGSTSNQYFKDTLIDIEGGSTKRQSVFATRQFRFSADDASDNTVVQQSNTKKTFSLNLDPCL